MGIDKKYILFFQSSTQKWNGRSYQRRKRTWTKLIYLARIISMGDNQTEYYEVKLKLKASEKERVKVIIINSPMA